MTPKVPDIGHREADKELYTLSKRLHKSYRIAAISLRGKLEKYLDQFAKEDTEKRALYDSGELSHEEYMAWRARKIQGTKQWKSMLEQITRDMTNQDRIAAGMIDDTLPEVYAINHNYGTFEAEKGSGIDTTYTMYDKFTVANLVKEEKVLLPAPKVDIPKDMQWNRQHIQSAVLQGILQGESMKGIADRLQQVVWMDERAAMRNARTAVTGAENAGRIDSYKRAESMGIKMKQVWMATLDGRTRDSHAALDGESIEVGKKFSNGCRYPGDPQGPASEVYNCRCTLVADVEGSDPLDPNARPSAYLEDEGLTYEQWKNRHSKKPKSGSNAFDRSKVQYSEGGRRIKERMDNASVEWREVKRLGKQLSDDEIIGRLSGGDMTRGSCMSLACAYVGNKSGLDVLDFRGNQSCDVMSRAHWDLINLAKVLEVTAMQTGGGVTPAKSLLKTVEPGKDYMLITGRHAAIVRKKDGVLQYLELQSRQSNGWKDFEYEWTSKLTGRTYKESLSDTLKKRFGCQGLGKLALSSLTDISGFEDSEEFLDLLGYINTAEDQQKKGSSGSIK